MKKRIPISALACIMGVVIAAVIFGDVKYGLYGSIGVIVFSACLLIFPDKREFGGKFLIDRSNTGRIICRVAFDADPLDYDDGDVIYFKIEKAEDLDKGIDINGD